MPNLFSFKRGDIAEAETFRQGLIDKGLEREVTGQQMDLNKQTLEAGEIGLRAARGAEAKRTEIEKTLNQPMDLDTLYGKRTIGKFAPETFKEIRQHVIDTGYAEPVTDPAGNVLYYKSTKAKQMDYMQKYGDEVQFRMNQGVAEMNTQIDNSDRQLSGSVDAESKPIAPITNPKQIQAINLQIRQLERAKETTMEMAGSHQKAMELQAGKGGEATGVVTWETPDGNFINLRKGEMPPQGSRQAASRSVRQSEGDAIDDAWPDALEALENRMGRKATAQEKVDLRQDLADNIKREGVRQVGAKQSTKEAVKALTPLREQAQKAFTGEKRIDKMIAMLDKGVTGKPGQLKKWAAGWLEFFPEISGETLDSYSEAQTFNLLGRIMTGPMRLDIVGPGPVSEYEQELWNKMSGGGGTARPAARELLNVYKNIAKEKVEFYNTSRDAASFNNPTVKFQFQKIGGDKGPQAKTIVDRQIDTDTGEVTAVKYSDGTIEEY